MLLTDARRLARPGAEAELIPVVRQNFSRDPKRCGSWWSRQTIIGSIQQEDSRGGQPACAWSAHTYKDRSKIDPDYAARL